MGTGRVVMFCIRCDAELEPDFNVPGDVPWNMNGGVTFSTDGNFGSTVFDAVGGPQRILITICDECLKLLDERWVFAYTTIKKMPEVKTTSLPWREDEEE